jgi:formyltetrahydrofolate deformylase
MPASPSESHLVRLIVSCPDGPGIVAAVAALLRDAGANIITSDQYTTAETGGHFFMRVEFAPAQGGEYAQPELARIEELFAEQVARRYGMRFRIWPAHTRKRVGILVSREDHCLLDLLWRWRRGELPIDVVLVASNHADLRTDVESFGVPYHHVPVDPVAKPQAEARLLELLAGVDLVILARYMQILTGEFLDRLGVPVINIHHSFLPAFAGARPYEQARARGVKLIGATAHYVTAELDAGPIIEQDVVRVSHRDDGADLERYGRDIERTVLARAVIWHCEDRVATFDGRTVVF